MCTSFGSRSIASAGKTWCFSSGAAALTCMASDQVLPPSVERTNNTLDCPFGSPKMRLVELDHARYSSPLRAAIAGCNVIREALMYLGKPNRPGPAFAEPCIVNRRLVPPHSVSSPGWVTGMTVGSGAPGTLNVAKRNVSPASSETSIWMKSWFALLKRRNGTYSVPVIWSTVGLEKVRQFCGCVGLGSAVGAKIVLAVHVMPPSVDRPKRS